MKQQPKTGGRPVARSGQAVTGRRSGQISRSANASRSASLGVDSRPIEEAPTRLERMMAVAGEAYCILDGKWRIVQCNPPLAKYFGFNASSLVGVNTFELNPKLRQSVFYPVLRDSMQKRTPGFRTGYSVRTGHWLMLRAYPFEDGIAVMVHDISELSDEQQRLTYLALHDSLTALPNRLALQQEIDEAIVARQEFTVVFLDLDRFKNVNDSAGHVIGDRVLMEMSARLSQLLEEGERLFRVGGDEFVLMTPAVDDRIDEKVRDMLVQAKHPILIAGDEFTLGATAGAASSPRDGDSYTTLIRRADMAMYAAKRDAAGTLRRYDPGLEASTVRKLTVEQALRRALSGDHLELHLQPKATLPGLKMTGAEALLRWHHPQRGLIEPTELLEVAEGCGLLVDIDRWVLKHAIEMLARFRREGVDMRIAVNLTAASFERPGLAEQTLDLLANYKVRPEMLEIEITESCLMRNTAVSAETLEALSSVGVRVCVDDFGTGYSSLAYLTDYAVDVLKIDPQFVRRASVDARSRNLVRGIVALAHTLEMEVVAEGVETTEQLALMKDLHCDAFQGFHYSRAIPCDEYIEFSRAC
ncbi:MAG: putative bifunctional diguanylate cyclase/phosphodiesterase [Burkholderiaceae bacterium]